MHRYFSCCRFFFFVVVVVVVVFLDDIKVFEPSEEVDSTVQMAVRCYR